MNFDINNSAKEKKQLLFLHGYLADRNSFVYQLKFFERYFEVFAPDLKGFGQNKGMDYPYSLDDYIKEVEEFKQKHGIIKPHVIAHSFGGRIAIKATAQNNDFCDKLVLTGSAGLKPKFNLKKCAKKCVFNLLKKVVDRKKLAFFYSSDYNQLNPIMKESFKLIVREHLDEKLEKINNQTLIINGKLDKDTPVYMAKRLNRGIKNSQLIVFEGAGHFCFIDKPAKFNLLTREFLTT